MYAETIIINIVPMAMVLVGAPATWQNIPETGLHLVKSAFNITYHPFLPGKQYSDATNTEITPTVTPPVVQPWTLLGYNWRVFTNLVPGTTTFQNSKYFTCRVGRWLSGPGEFYPPIGAKRRFGLFSFKL